MGSARTQLTREFLSPLYDIEAALFIPTRETRLREYVVDSKGRRDRAAKEVATAG